MPFDINVAFNVETKELVNARNALQSLVQVSKDINSSQDKAAKTAEALVKANDKVAESAKSASKALEDSAKSAEKTEKSTKSLASEGDAAANKLARLKDQLSFLRDDLNLSEVGFTKSQAGVLAWAKSVGASSGIIKEFASTFDNLNKVSGQNPFDNSVKGLNAINSELRELKQVQSLAAEGFGLTAKQVQMLSRDMEGIRQQNEAFGRSAEEGVQKHRTAFIEVANSVNSYKEQIKSAQREAENLFKAEQEMARNRKLVNDELMKGWGSNVGGKSEALKNLADQYAEEERMASAHQAKLQQINATAGNAAADEFYKRQAAATKIADDAIEQLERDTRKLIVTNELMDRGFTSSSANAIYKYKEALQATGVSAMELKQKLYLLEQDLMKRQNTSPFARMREDIKQVTQQTNHLARAISVQLGDVAISLAGGQNPFVVLMQQGDQIRGAVQQAVDAGQKIDQAMKGAFVSMAQSAKLVGVVIKEFVMDGLRSVGNALEVVSKHTAEVNAINKRYENGTISLTRSQRLLTVQSLQLDKAMGTLRIAALGVAGVFGGILLKAFYDLSKEQDSMAKANVQFGAMFGASTQEAITLSKSLMGVGVSSKDAQTAMEEMMKTGTLGKESFQGIAKAASDAQKYVGISIEDTVKKFGALAKDPIKVLSEFTQETGYLSQAQLQLVRDLVEAGNGAEAQRVAIKLLEEGYKSMTSQAQEDMSALGRATVTLKDSTSTLWDEFKNSSVVELALKGVKLALGILNGAVQAVVISAKTLWATLVAAGKGLKALYENALDPSQMVGAFNQIGKEWTAAIDKALLDGADSMNKFNDAATGAVDGTKNLTAEQRKLNAANEQVSLSLDKMNKSNEEHAKKLVKNLDLRTYVGKRIMEENKELTKNFTDDQKKSFYESEQYKSQILLSEKRFQKEWEDAHKKKEGKPKETYQVNRDNELQETKRFYDAQLKQLKDFETKQSQINKAAYEGKAITYGQYVAKEIELVTSSQQQQLEIIQKSETAFRENIEKRRKAQEVAAASAIKAGANSTKINEKLSQELKNLTNESITAEEGFKGLRSALENSTNAKFAEFYKELSKSIFDSNEELKKFTKTVNDNARKRTEDLALQEKLLNSYGGEADAIKATASAMRGYEGDIRSTEKALEEATKRRKDLEARMSTVVGVEAYNELSRVAEESARDVEALTNDLAKKLALAQKDANQAGADAMREYNLKVFKDIRDSLSENIYDAIFEGGKSGGQALKNVLKNMFKNYVINVILNPISNQITGSFMNAFGMNSSEKNSGGMKDNSIADWSTWGAKGSSFVMEQGINLVSKGWDATGSALMSLGNTIQRTDTWLKNIPGMSGGIGSALGYAGSIFALAKGDYGTAIGSAIGTAILPGVGTMIGSMLGGLTNGLFGRTLKDSGVEGTFGGEQGFSGNTYEYYKGGLFRSNKTVRNPLDESVRSQLADQFLSAQASIKSMGDTLGLFTSNLADQTYSIKLSLKGLSEEDATKALQAEFERIAESMASTVLATEQYSQANETSLQTLTRLSSNLVAFNQSLDMIGLTAYDASLKSADAASKIIAAFGGIEGYAQTFQGFFESFYSEKERMDKQLSQVREALTSVGVGIDPAMGDLAKQQFRATVEAALAGGQTELAVKLLSMNQLFAETADYAQRMSEESVARLNEIMAQEHMLWADLAEAEGDFATAAQRRYWIETAGMTLAEQAAYDYNAAIRAQISSAQAASNALKSLSATQWDLENQLLTLEGKTGAVEDRVRTKELADLLEGVEDEVKRKQITAAYDYNASLRKQIEAAQAAAQAANATAQAQQQAADKIRNTWQGIADSIVNEIKRIRGEVLKDSDLGLEYYQAQFALATAQARAGDEKAAERLPELSQALLKMAESSVSTLAELQRYRNQTSRSLEETLAALASKFGVTYDLPKFDVGTNYVPQTTAAIVHKGEAIVPEEFNPWARGASPAMANFSPVTANTLRIDTTALEQKLESLENEVVMLRAEARATAINTGKTYRIMDDVTQGGDTIRTEVVA